MEPAASAEAEVGHRCPASWLAPGARARQDAQRQSRSAVPAIRRPFSHRSASRELPSSPSLRCRLPESDHAATAALAVQPGLPVPEPAGPGDAAAVFGRRAEPQGWGQPDALYDGANHDHDGRARRSREPWTTSDEMFRDGPRGRRDAATARRLRAPWMAPASGVTKRADWGPRNPQAPPRGGSKHGGSDGATLAAAGSGVQGA